MIAVGSIFSIIASLWILPRNKLLEQPIDCLKEACLWLAVLQVVVSNLFVPRFRNSVFGILASGLGFLFFYSLAILFGAHVLERVEATVYGSLYLSLLVFYSAGFSLKLDSNSWMKSITLARSSSVAERSVFVRFLFTLLGAWMGAILLPLDWQRSYIVTISFIFSFLKKWPIPLIIGGQSGAILAIVMNSLF